MNTYSLNTYTAKTGVYKYTFEPKIDKEVQKNGTNIMFYPERQVDNYRFGGVNTIRQENVDYYELSTSKASSIINGYVNSDKSSGNGFLLQVSANVPIYTDDVFISSREFTFTFYSFDDHSMSPSEIKI